VCWRIHRFQCLIRYSRSMIITPNARPLMSTWSRGGFINVISHNSFSYETIYIIVCEILELPSLDFTIKSIPIVLNGPRFPSSRVWQQGPFLALFHSISLLNFHSPGINPGGMGPIRDNLYQDRTVTFDVRSWKLCPP